MFAIVHERTGQPATSGNEPLVYDDEDRAFHMAEQWNMATAHIPGGNGWNVRPLTREEVKMLHRTGYKRFSILG
jgi:hypothetical protein